MALWIDMGPDDVLTIGECRVTLEHKSGRRIRLAITGPDSVELLKKARIASTSQMPLNLPAVDTGD